MSSLRFSYRIAFFTNAFVALFAVTPAIANGCQSGSSANNTTTFLLTHVNCQANASGQNSMAVGRGARASDQAGIAIGWSAIATGGIAIGYGSVSGQGLATGYFAETSGSGTLTSIGNSARTRGNHATSVGFAAGPDFDNTSTGATAVGAYAGKGALGNFATAIGAGSDYATAPQAGGGYSIAIGGSNDNIPGAKSQGYRSIAIGQRSFSADFGTSVGFNTHTGFAATAVGTDATAAGDGGSAFGRFAKASAKSAVALGEGAVASTARSVAIGSGSLANVAGTVSVGAPAARRRIVNVAPGIANTDVPTLGQVKNIATAAAVEALVDAGLSKTSGDGASSDLLQREVFKLRAMVEALQQKVADLEQRSAVAQVE